MKIVLNSIKVIGLILLSLVCNIIPMYLLQYQNKLSLPAKWGLGLVYIALIILVIYFLWQAHKKHDSAEVATQKMTAKDIGIALLFFLVARVVAITGTLINQILSGQSTMTNDAALQSLTAFFKNGFFLYTLLYVILVGIVGPIIEEMAYRAFPNHLWFKNSHKVLAGIITTLLFAFPNATTLFEFVLYACIGAILYLAYARRGNIKDSMLVHILNNLPTALYFLFIALK
ncbi:CPBP family intramembrane glutamic endopeptidase [Streptococcus mutans]|uniref:CPBP family intramembrane glutamic endopeptidase n=1 Tax=Streptococcus mutans TaxID=1309 RepID=UPI00030B24C9|nr:type II CAAX endopeptidase family protein [Streptococcus mutans]